MHFWLGTLEIAIETMNTLALATQRQSTQFEIVRLLRHFHRTCPATYQHGVVSRPKNVLCLNRYKIICYEFRFAKTCAMSVGLVSQVAFLSLKNSDLGLLDGVRKP